MDVYIHIPEAMFFILCVLFIITVVDTYHKWMWWVTFFPVCLFIISMIVLICGVALAFLLFVGVYTLPTAWKFIQEYNILSNRSVLISALLSIPITYRTLKIIEPR